jgi:hypothetical protein
MQEAEGAPAAGDRTGILRFLVGEQEATSALRFVRHRRGIFSALLDVLHPRPPFLGSCNTEAFSRSHWSRRRPPPYDPRP